MRIIIIIIILHCILYVLLCIRKYSFNEARFWSGSENDCFEMFPLKQLWATCILNNCYEGPKFSIIRFGIF